MKKNTFRIINNFTYNTNVFCRLQNVMFVKYFIWKLIKQNNLYFISADSKENHSCTCNCNNNNINNKKLHSLDQYCYKI